MCDNRGKPDGRYVRMCAFDVNSIIIYTYLYFYRAKSHNATAGTRLRAITVFASEALSKQRLLYIILQSTKDSRVDFRRSQLMVRDDRGKTGGQYFYCTFLLMESYHLQYVRVYVYITSAMNYILL